MRKESGLVSFLKNLTHEKVNNFLNTPNYIVVMTLLTALSFALGGEIVYYLLIVLLAGYICIFSEDLLPLVPIFVFVYVAPSVHNNPGRADNTLFSGGSLIFVILIGLVLLGCFAYRIIRDREKYFRRGNRLMPGILVLCGAYLLSGVGSAGYWSVAGKNFLFSLAQCAGVLLPYWLFTNGIDWKKVRKDYLSWIGVGVGCVLMLEVLCIYYLNSVLSNGVIDRERIYAGWGMRNNIGCLMAMAIPFAFSLAVHYHKGRYGIMGGAIFLFGVLLTCSRTSMIFGIVAYLGCVGLLFFSADNWKRNLTSTLGIIGVILALVLIFNKPLRRMFDDVIYDTSELGHRFAIYRNGFKSFFRAPIFGTTFYPGRNLTWGWASSDVRNVLPDRWHNTVIQLLASCGVVGFAAYVYHRVQTVQLALKFRSREKRLVAISVVVMLLCSQLDCHFFNVGPTLFYSTILAFLEKQE